MINSSIPGLEEESHKNGVIHYRCKKDEFSKAIFYLGSEFSYTWLIGIRSFETSETNLKLKYYFFDFDENRRFTISFEISRGETYSSVASLWKNAKFYEDRIFEETGLEAHIGFKFRSTIKDDRLYLPELSLRLESNLRQNNNKLSIRFQDEKIAMARLEHQKYHIGFERLISRAEPNLRFQALESYYPKKAVFWSQSMAMIMESSRNIEVPDRAKAIRMILMELSRILNHLFDFKYLADDFANSMFKEFSSLWIKKIQSLLISYSGNEFGANIIRVGGVCLDVNQSWGSRAIDDLGTLDKNLVVLIRDFLFTLESNEDSLNKVLLTKNEVMNWSMTGPLARSTGVNLDMRKREAFYFYKDIEFDVPLGVGGTLYDLISVKLEEIRQSTKIIIQVLDNLPTGNFYFEGSDFQFFHGIDENREDIFRDSVKRFLKSDDSDGMNFLEGPGGMIGLEISLLENSIQEEKQEIKMLGTQFSDGCFFELALEGKSYEDIFPFWTAMNLDMKEIER